MTYVATGRFLSKLVDLLADLADLLQATILYPRAWEKGDAIFRRPDEMEHQLGRSTSYEGSGDCEKCPLLAHAGAWVDAERRRAERERWRRVAHFQQVRRWVLLFSLALLPGFFTLSFVKVRAFFGSPVLNASFPWRTTFSPLFVVCVLYLALNCGSLLSRDLRDAQWHHGVALSSRAVLAWASFMVSLAAWVLLLDGHWDVTLFQAWLPFILGLSVLLVADAWMLVLRGSFGDAADPDERRFTLYLRFEFCVTLLSVPTVALVALRWENSLALSSGGAQLSWAAVLAWPTVIAIAYVVIAASLSVLVGWCVVYGALKKLVPAPPNVVLAATEGLEMTELREVLLVVACCSVCFDAIVALVVVAGTWTVRLLSLTRVNIDMCFIPLIVASMILACLMLAFEFGVEPFFTDLLARAAKRKRVVTGRRTGSSGGAHRVHGCFVCHERVERIISINDNDGHAVPAELLGNGNDKEGTQKMKGASSSKVECAVCCIREADAVLVPCGHGGICSVCAERWVLGNAARSYLEGRRERSQYHEPDTGTSSGAATRGAEFRPTTAAVVGRSLALAEHEVRTTQLLERNPLLYCNPIDAPLFLVCPSHWLWCASWSVFEEVPQGMKDELDDELSEGDVCADIESCEVDGVRVVEM